jgi:hypothetical protein
MIRRFSLPMLLLSCVLNLYAQVSENEYHKVSLSNPDWNEYPAVKVKVDYYSWADSLSPAIIDISESNLTAKLISTKKGIKENSINIHFIVLESDSAKTFQFIQKLNLYTSTQHLPVDAFISVFTDSCSNWCELDSYPDSNKSNRIVYDTLTFKRLFSSAIRGLVRPENICILITEDLTIKTLELLNETVQNTRDSDLPFFILLYRKSKIKEEDIKLAGSKSLWISSTVFDPAKADPSNFFQAIHPLLNSAYILTWESPDTMSLNTQRTIYLKAGKSSIQVNAFIPDSILHSYYASKILNKANVYLNRKQTDSCLVLLKNSYHALALDDFIKKSDEVLTQSAEDLIKMRNPKPFTILTDLESLTDLNFNNSYQIKKYNWALAFYDQVDKANEQPDELVKIAEYLLLNSPNDTNQARVNWSKARYSISQGNSWNALDEFYKAYLLIKDQRIAVEIKKLTDVCLKEASLNKDWAKLRNYGTTYNEFLKNDFDLRYLFGRACFEMHDYSKAISQFEWIIFNWKENNQITWENAFDILQNAYTLSFRFNEAVKLNQRIFREKQRQESLLQIVMNLRLANLKICMDAFEAWLANLVISNKGGVLIDFNPVLVPSYISSVRLFGMQNQDKQILYPIKQTTTIAEPLFKASNICSSIQIEHNTAWFLSKISDDKHVSIMLKNEILDETEKNLLLEITKDPMDNKLWDKLFQYEERIGCKLVSQLCTAMMESTFRLNGKIGFEQYWSQISKNHLVQYMIFHSKDGSVIQKGFVPGKEKYSPTDWQKSCKANAYYHIEIENNGKNISDLTNPIYGIRNWEGSLRLGIERKF